MFIVEVTEFVRPNADQLVHKLQIPPVAKLKEKYDALTESGCRITLEVINNEFCVCIEDNVVEEDYLTNVGKLGSSLLGAVIGIIDSYDETAHAKWCEVMQRINADEPPF